MIVRIDGKARKVSVRKGWTYADIIERIGLCVEDVVVLKDGLPVPEDSRVLKGKVEIVRIGSSG